MLFALKKTIDKAPPLVGRGIRQEAIHLGRLGQETGKVEEKTAHESPVIGQGRGFELQLAQLLEDELAAVGTPYLVSDAPSWIDIQSYFPVWMANTNIPRAEELLAPFPAIHAWSERMEQIGRGKRCDIDASTAHEIARASEPLPGDGVAANPFHEFKTGDAVTVVPDDYGFDPVEGRLTRLDTRRITIERYADAIGSVAVHFPRAGYRIAAA